MAFDPNTAKPVVGFNPSTAKQVQEAPQEQGMFSQFMQAAQSPIAQNMLSGPIGMAAQATGNAMDRTFGPEAANKAGGWVTDVTGSPELGVAANLGLQAIPMALGGGIGKTLAKGGGEVLMQKALKPLKAEMLSGEGMRAIKTMLGEGVNVSPGGVAKLKGMIDDINTQITNAIRGSTAKIDKREVINATQRSIDKFRDQVDNADDLATIFKAIDRFSESMPDQIRIQLAQRLKQGTYKILGEKSYGELKTASTEVQKDLARGLKDEIAKLYPKIGELNARESKLIEAHSMALARTLMHQGRDAVSLAWLVTHPAAALGYVAEKSPFIMSLLARASHQGAAGALAGTVAPQVVPRILPGNQSGNQ